VTARVLSNARGTTLLGDLIERQKALAGARVGRARRQMTQVRRRLAPPRRVNAQHNRPEKGSVPALTDRKSALKNHASQTGRGLEDLYVPGPSKIEAAVRHVMDYSKAETV
jgi:hypothetical protein